MVLHFLQKKLFPKPTVLLIKLLSHYILSAATVPPITCSYTFVSYVIYNYNNLFQDTIPSISIQKLLICFVFHFRRVSCLAEQQLFSCIFSKLVWGYQYKQQQKKYKKIIKLKNFKLSCYFKIFHLHNFICWFSTISQDYLIIGFLNTLLLQNLFTNLHKTSYFKAAATNNKESR